jgi:hypothetical protein
MGKLATLPKRAPTAPVKSKKGRKPNTRTATGGEGFTRDAKSELFLLAVTNMVSEKTFHEEAAKRDSRFEKLIRKVAHDDPDWLARFVPYLRDTMNMRSASIILAAETVHSKLTQPVAASQVSNRTIIDSAIQRADEPAEMLGYWMSAYGKNFPMPVKRGVADAVMRLYNERSVIKYDGGKHAIQFADVIELVHPGHKAPWQGVLYKHLLDKRHGHDLDTEDNISLRVLLHNRKAMALTQAEFQIAFSPEYVDTCGLTWEQASSKYGKLDGKFWESMIPNMGIFALVRNLRNFEEAGISPAAREVVKAKLADPVIIASSRMFPLRFFTAMVNTDSLQYHEALEEAINASLTNVPVLTGKSLILVDLSPSMEWTISDRSKVKRLAPASIFGSALAVRADQPTLVGYSGESEEIKVRKGSVLLTVQNVTNALKWRSGTYTWTAVKRHFANHDRVIIITDEQSHDSMVDSGLDESVPVYTFNVAGYRPGTMPSGKKNRYVFGGLSDAGFTALELLERGQDADWPF